MSQEITGALAKIIFQAESGDFCVAEFINSLGQRFRASGNIKLSAKADAKQLYLLIGQWENLPKYGQSFVTIYSEAQRPAELGGIAPYLANNVKGIGEITAKKLVSALGIEKIEDLVLICRQQQEKIFAFFSAKKKKIAENIIHAMVVDEVFRNIMIFLHEHNIHPNFAKKIYQKYGANSIYFLQENPYRLISDFRRVGFLRADAIAQKLGISPVSIFRIEAAFIYTLEIAQNDGHCCLPRDLLVRKACDLLGGKNDANFSYEFVLGELRNIFKKNKALNSESFVIRQLVGGEILFYLPEILVMENNVAAALALLLKNSMSLDAQGKKIANLLQKPDTSLAQIFPNLAWDKLSDEQRYAVELSLNSRLMIVTGGPGCGKTFVLKTIYALQRALNRKVALCAPTGLAAKRMSLAIGEFAVTLHKLLGLGQRSDNEPLDDFSASHDLLNDIDVVIVDESSMLSLDLLHSLVSKLGHNRRLILVGDINQLPSISAGNCLKDLISTEDVPIARLTRIFRQSDESPIPIAAHAIISGAKLQYSYITNSHIFVAPEPLAFISCLPENFFAILLPFLSDTIKNVYNLDPIRDCQILVPMRRSEVGQENINKILQDYFNPTNAQQIEIALAHGGNLRIGDKVMQSKNNYELDIYNGDLGYCTAILKNDDEFEVIIDYNGKKISYDEDALLDVQLCYAMTIHKSQGSEFPLCIIPMFGVYFNMLDRNLLYTALTRAAKYVIIIGEEWAVRRSIKNQNSYKRYTALTELLHTELLYP